MITARPLGSMFYRALYSCSNLQTEQSPLDLQLSNRPSTTWFSICKTASIGNTLPTLILPR